MSAPAERTLRPRNQTLDALRGIAIVLVMLRHAFPAQFPGAGVVGIVVFFTLSGYLITGLLQDELVATNGISLLGFYRRRLARLAPALLVLVAGMTAVTVLIDPIGDRHTVVRTIAMALTWTADIPQDGTSPAAFHLWTLALEEQFYLGWPLVLLVLHRIGRTRGGVYAAVAACWLAALVTTLWLIEDPDLGYALPTSWAVSMAIGAAFRVATSGDRHPSNALVVAASLALLNACMVDLRGHVFTYVGLGPAIAGLAGVLLLWSRAHPRLRWPPLRIVEWLGHRSYSAYLWNYPLSIWLDAHAGTARALLTSALTLIAAELSYRLVERPSQKALSGKPTPGWRSPDAPFEPVDGSRAHRCGDRVRHQ